MTGNNVRYKNNAFYGVVRDENGEQLHITAQNDRLATVARVLHELRCQDLDSPWGGIEVYMVYKGQRNSTPKLVERIDPEIDSDLSYLFT